MLSGHHRWGVGRPERWGPPRGPGAGPGAWPGSGWRWTLGGRPCDRWGRSAASGTRSAGSWGRTEGRSVRRRSVRRRTDAVLREDIGKHTFKGMVEIPLKSSFNRPIVLFICISMMFWLFYCTFVFWFLFACCNLSVIEKESLLSMAFPE